MLDYNKCVDEFSEEEALYMKKEFAKMAKDIFNIFDKFIEENKITNNETKYDITLNTLRIFLLTLYDPLPVKDFTIILTKFVTSLIHHRSKVEAVH